MVRDHIRHLTGQRIKTITEWLSSRSALIICFTVDLSVLVYMMAGAAAMRIAPGADCVDLQPVQRIICPYGISNTSVHYPTLRACGPAYYCLSERVEAYCKPR